MTSLSGTNFNNREAVGPKGEGRDSPTSFSVYPEFKDSGIEWLGDVPKHWSISKFARHFQVRMGETIPEGELTEDGWLPVYSATEKDKYYGFVSSRKPLAKPGDLIIPARGNSIGHVKLVKRNVTATQTTIVANNLDFRVVQAKFAYYWSSGLREILFHFDRTAIPQITTEYVSRNKIVLPNLKEQIQVARFLDHETARIDALIEEQQRLIELLKEKRQAVISHAVTKGLDPNVPMKDSGVEWLGEVPEHWRTGALRWYATIQGGIAKGKDYEGKETVILPYLRVANVQNGYVNLSEVKEIAVLNSEVERYSLRAGDVLMNEGGDNDKLGRGTVWQGQIEPCLHQNHVFAIRPIECLLPQWLANFTQTDQARTYFFLNSKQSTNLASISASNVMNMTIPIPPVTEQMEIIAWLEKDREKYEQLVEVAQAAVTLLKERRSALISAAVTGKIDVRNWQPDQPNATDTDDYAMVVEPAAEYS